MAASPLDSALYGPLLADPEVGALFGDAAEIASLLRVEAALAQVQGRLGVIPAEAAARILAALTDAIEDPVALDLGALAARTAADGVALPGLVEALRRLVGGEAAAFLHWGATSQDIADTGLILRLRDALTVLEARTAAVIAALAALADAHRGTPMAARTRGQQATPIRFGLKAANWLAPLLRQRQRLAELRPRLLAVQFGGAAGDLSALGDDGPAVADGLADALGLARAEPWHTQRDRLLELGNWLAMTTAALGKLGGDLILLAQSEVGEIRLKGAGGSSTMPHKQNPVGPEMLVALARFTAGQLGTLHQAALQDHERDGAAWTLEWLTLPGMVVAAAAALRHAAAVLAALEVDSGRMRAALQAGGGLAFAEAASFALARHMPRPAAQALVKAAVAKLVPGADLLGTLATMTDAPVDWPALREPAAGATELLIDRILAVARTA